MSKNILFLANQLPGFGGVESVTNTIIDYLGDRHAVYTLSQIHQSQAPVPAKVRVMYHFPSQVESECVRLLDWIITEHRIDVIVNQGVSPEITRIIFGSSCLDGVKVLSFLHGMPKYEIADFWAKGTNRIPRKRIKRQILAAIGLFYKHKKYGRQFAEVYTQACRDGHKFVLLCEGYIQPFIKAYHLSAYRDKVLVICNPLPRSYASVEAPCWERKKNQVLYVGRLSPEKRVGLLLDIWKTVADLTDWELVLVGDGDLRPELEMQVRDAQIPRVTFAGYTNAPESYYRDAKLLLLTSLHEGFGMCLAEAQRFGTVPLAFSISEGVRTIVANGGGVLVEQDDYKTMARRLRKLMSEPEVLREMSLCSYAVSERFTINAIGRKWDELLESE